VQGSLVRAKKNPVTGFVVVADVVAKSEGELSTQDMQALRASLTQFCRKSLASHKIPVSFNFVPELSVGGSGKMSRPRTHA
jgi:acyl-coenzyme A synthetase/AMP-(fatty) acid ligase